MLCTGVRLTIRVKLMPSLVILTFYGVIFVNNFLGIWTPMRFRYLEVWMFSFSFFPSFSILGIVIVGGNNKCCNFRHHQPNLKLGGKGHWQSGEMDLGCPYGHHHLLSSSLSSLTISTTITTRRGWAPLPHCCRCHYECIAIITIEKEGEKRK